MTSRPASTLDAAALLLDFCDGVVLNGVHQAHRSVSQRFFAPTRPVGGDLAEAVHDAFVDTAYATGSGVLRMAGTTLRSLSARGLGMPLEATTPGRRVIAAVNTLAGSHLERTADPHAIAMAVRVARTDLPLTKFHVGNAFRNSTGHLVVLVHGLAESDETWSSGPVDHVDAIANATSGTPIVLRYNTGLTPAHNGRLLDIIVSQLVQLWPTRPTRITFVGHQMGGLVARSALNAAVARQRAWSTLVRDMIFLGQPRVGSAIERATALSRRPLRLARPRVRVGHVGPDVWEGEDVTTLWGNGRNGAAPLTTVDHWFAVTEPGSFALRSSEVAGHIVRWIELRDSAPRAISS